MNTKNQLIFPDISNPDPVFLYNYFNENCLNFLERKFIESLLIHKDLDLIENHVVFKFNTNKITCTNISGILKLYLNFAIINQESPYIDHLLNLKEEVTFPHPFVIFLKNLKADFKREIDIFHILNTFKELHNSHIFDHRLFKYRGLWNPTVLEPNLKELFEESGIVFND